MQALDKVQTLSLASKGVGTAVGLPPMDSLRLLNLGNVSLLDASGLTCCSSLRYLEWHAAASETALPTKLAVLDLNFSGLRALPESISMLRGLHRLDLRECRALNGLPDAISQLTGLTALNLTHANLKVLPPSVSALTSLQVLELENCDSCRSCHRASALLPACSISRSLSVRSCGPCHLASVRSQGCRLWSWDTAARSVSCRRESAPSLALLS